MPALNAQSAILDICREFSESRPNRKVVPSTPRLSFWTVLFRHNHRHNRVRRNSLVNSNMAVDFSDKVLELTFRIWLYENEKYVFI